MQGKKIYKVGGAQAIAGFAFGTETINKVDKIFGPGNEYVSLAKKEVFGETESTCLQGHQRLQLLLINFQIQNG